MVLYLSLRQLKRQLGQRRQQMREQFEALSRGEGFGGPSQVPAGIAGIELSEAGAAAEVRARYALKQDLRCPITLEVMRDPVIAGDGHSYEREAIERWLRNHHTSPLTGRVMPSSALLPNHRLRTLIQDLEVACHGGGDSARAAPPRADAPRPPMAERPSPAQNRVALVQDRLPP